jgi:hypothetical protein
VSAWPGRSSEEKRGFDETRAVRAKLRADEAARLKRAVSDVLDGTCSMTDAAKGQGLPYDRVAKAVKAVREKAP